MDVEIEADVQTEAQSENPDSFYYVPFVHNGYIIQELRNGNSLLSLTRWLMKFRLDLREAQVRSAIQSLKRRQYALQRSSKRQDGKLLYDDFLATEFKFPDTTNLIRRYRKIK
jgi:hypothetical protein